ncbi:MAG: hypothetical protein IKO86_00595, partial [Prevotella sp.]|nr:hypothetical protein [Prevotella sp.]
MKKKLFTLISMFLPMMASAYDAGNSFDLSQSPWEGVAEYVSDFDSDSNVNKTRTAGAVNMSVIFTNVSNEDIYITGHMYIAVRTADDSDWGPIHVNLVPYSKGVAQYVIPAKTRAVIPPSMLDIFVNGNKEPVSKYFGGHIFYFSPGDPVYWRVYSWTTAHDPAVVKSTPGTFNFTNGGVIEFVLNRTDEAKEGRIVRSSNPTVLGGGTITPPQEQQQQEQQQQQQEQQQQQQ